VIVERSMHASWLSNTWLVADRPGGHALLIDSGGPPEPILARIAALELTPTHVLCTHHHHDHVAHNALYRERFGIPVCGHPAELALFGTLDHLLEEREIVASGALRARALHIPGHTRGQLAFVLDEERVFTGDTLFHRSVGGTRAPGHASFEELQDSILERLMRLPHDFAVHPGHTEDTTIGAEWEHNPFVRLWRGLDAPGDAACLAFGRPATLLLRARDYDGGTKCQVRFDADGRVDVVPGSRVEERPAR
jgi:glyoxylase-like metal-dependent hydrolase (beta-lactamase superfamily II)